MPRELTQKQRLFLDVLFDKAQGSIVQAKKLAIQMVHHRLKLFVV